MNICLFGFISLAIMHVIHLFSAVPRISTYDVTVIEGIDDFATIIFNRTGGNLDFRSRIFASTVETTGMH